MQASLLDWRGAPPPEQPRAPLKLVRTPRSYQLEALDGGGSFLDTADGKVKPYPGVIAALEAHQSAVLVLFTGGGKSFIAAQVAMARPGRTLVLVHTHTLAEQFRAELMETTGRPWQLEKADFRAVPEGGIDVVASVQTIAQPARLERFRPDSFDTLIVDEAHHYTGEFFGRPLAYFRSAKTLLLTATPNRHDGVALGSIGNVVAYRKDLAAALAEGWSTPIDWQPLDATVDLTGVDLNEFGEFVPGQYDEAIARQIAPVCRAAIEKCGDMRTIVFVPGLKAARAGAAAMCKTRPDCARYVAGQQEMDPDVAEQILREHKAGRFQFLFSCRKLTEGYDDQQVLAMIDAAKTKSNLLCIQKVGRIARLWPGLGDVEDEAERKAAIVASPKPKAIWFDLAYNHPGRLAGPLDVLGGEYTQVERDWAALFLKKAGGGDVGAALVAGRKHEELLAKKRAQAAARRAKRLAAEEQARGTAAAAAGADVQLRELPKKKPKKEKLDPSGPPTERTAKWLEAHDVPVPATHALAMKAMNRERLALDREWCNWKQRDWLGRFGINAWAMPRERGAKLCAAIVANGRQRLSDAQYRAALGKGDAGAEG